MNDKRREQALAVYCEHNTGNANANYYEMRDSAVASMLAFTCDQMTEKDAEIAQLRAVIACLKRERLRGDMNKDEMLESIFYSLERIEAKLKEKNDD